MSHTTTENKLDWILVAKGIGIILVVTGHFFPANAPAYWVATKEVIYTFHMPLFFFLSGWLYQHGKYPYRELVTNKAQRLLYPFASIAFLFFLIKFTAGLFFTLDNPVNMDSLSTLLVNPVKSYMPLLWFVHALFLIFLFYPLARNYLGDITLLVIFLGLNLLVDSETPFIGKPLHHIPFFIAGIIVRDRRQNLAPLLDASLVPAPLLLLLFAAACYLLQWQEQDWPLAQYPLLFVAGITGTLLTIKASQAIANAAGKPATILLATGYYSMTIYLFHTLFESGARIVLLQAFRKFGIPFELVALVAITAGLVFPLLLEKYCLRKIRLTRKYILGLS